MTDPLTQFLIKAGIGAPTSPDVYSLKWFSGYILTKKSKKNL